MKYSNSENAVPFTLRIPIKQNETNVVNEMKDIRSIVETDTHITEFQRKVYLALLDVPRGTTISYRELGERVGCKSAQAIGQALKHNPFAPDVPCHRVISSNGEIGGFHGQRNGDMIEKKRQLLEEEGATVIAPKQKPNQRH